MWATGWPTWPGRWWRPRSSRRRCGGRGAGSLGDRHRALHLRVGVAEVLVDARLVEGERPLAGHQQTGVEQFRILLRLGHRGHVVRGTGVVEDPGDGLAGF